MGGLFKAKGYIFAEGFKNVNPHACLLSRLGLLDVIILIGGFETNRNSLISDRLCHEKLQKRTCTVDTVTLLFTLKNFNQTSKISILNRIQRTLICS